MQLDIKIIIICMLINYTGFHILRRHLNLIFCAGVSVGAGGGVVILFMVVGSGMLCQKRKRKGTYTYTTLTVKHFHILHFLLLTRGVRSSRVHVLLGKRQHYQSTIVGFELAKKKEHLIRSIQHSVYI